MHLDKKPTPQEGIEKWVDWIIEHQEKTLGKLTLTDPCSVDGPMLLKPISGDIPEEIYEEIQKILGLPQKT